MSTFEAIFTSPVTWIGSRLASVPKEPIRRAVVLVAAERQAHAIRRHVCVERERPEQLAGVLFLRPVEFARELLVRAGHVRTAAWEDVRRLRVLELFESGMLAGSLRYFNAEQLRSGQGYVDAFARTITDLEASGLDASLAVAVADGLAGQDRQAADRLHDVAITWEAADANRGIAATDAQLLTEAAELAAGRPELLAPFGPIFAVLAASPPTTLLRFLRALPACHVVFQEARPLRPGTQRWRQLLPASETVDKCEDVLREPQHERSQSPSDKGLSAHPEPVEGCFERKSTYSSADSGHNERPVSADSELDLVQHFLFALPEVLTDPRRLRSTGPDGTVDLEEYPSIEDEIEAAATWVTEQIAAGTPLEHIALVVPEVDAYAPLLSDRLARLPSDSTDNPIRTYVAGGLALAAFPAGMRLYGVLQAVARGLEAEATIRVLPALRRGESDGGYGRVRLSPSRAAAIVYGAGILGGTPGDPAGVGEWVPRLTRRRDALRSLLEAATKKDGDPGARADVRDRVAAERWLRDVEPILPAISELQELAENVIAGAGLAAVWHGFRAFCARRLRIPPQPANILGLLDQRVQPILADAVAARVTGFSAVRFLMDLLRSKRQSTARFGEPCVFIGTASQASGLPFCAARVLGLAEGALPHTPHDDPIVPDVLRPDIETTARSRQKDADIVIPRLADRVLDDIHDVFRVVSGAQVRLALSAPRQWVDRSEREVSGIMLEVATALGRQGGGTDEGDVPTSARLRAVYLNAGRDARLRNAGQRPLSPRAVLAAVQGALPHAAGIVVVPADWMDDGALAVDQLWQRLAAVGDHSLSAMDGIVTEAWAVVPQAGLFPRHPISASALTLLLRCPHQFLLTRVLHLSAPTPPPSADVIDPTVYGSLFHTAAERFYHEAGAAVCRRQGDVETWIARARTIAEEAFDELRHEYPMRGEDGIARARNRLLRQIEQLVLYEWNVPPREFLESEMTFGAPDSVRVALETGDLYVWGKIDRIDRMGAQTLAVRDLKTGRVRDFGEDPINAGRDLQIGVYVLALEASGYGGAPVGVAAYVHPSTARDPDRAFEGSNMEVLRRHTREWLGIARQLLSGGLFPRTPNRDDCKYCPFAPACGDGAAQRAAVKLDNLPPAHALEPFARFKRQESERGR
ncbi:MAG: PD-(D/E)XK nuclease family protein [Candidatus Binatia bacterium]